MSKDGKSSSVSRVEYYSTVGLIWLFIGMIAWDLGSTGNKFSSVLMTAVAYLMSICYSFVGISMAAAARRERARISDAPDPGPTT